MRLGYQNQFHNNSENRNDSLDNMSSNEDYSSHPELDPNNNNKLNKSFTEDDSSSKPKRSSSQIKEKTFFQFMTAIFNNDRKQVEKMYASSPNPGIVDHIFLEGMTPIQYAALYGSIDCFKFLMEKKVDTDKTVEGLNLIHLSLSRAIFKNDKEKCVQMFKYIYDKLPKQKEYKDRLGRTYLHIIFEYDFTYALKDIEINLDDLFVQDNNGDFVINYVYLYNANLCFFKVAKDPECLSNLYKQIRARYESNNKSKENFLENLFIHQNFYSIAIILINCKLFIDELIEDLISLKNFYSEENYLNNKNNHEYNNICEKNVYKLNDNINYALDIANNLKKGIEFRGKFNFPQKIKFFTGIFYNLNCIQHIKLPEEPLKHIMARISLFENSDRLSMLIDSENGIVLNEQVLHYIEGISYEEKINKTSENSSCENVIFYESQRKSCLNDVLKCHDINYIKKLKDICYSKANNSSLKKQENHSSLEKGINVPKILSHLDSSNPIYKNIYNINYQSHFRKLDIDTYVNEYSFENIFNTSGCVLDAIDYIFNDKIKNALVLIRPPGHNSGFFGPVENSNLISTGFCLVNNVTIGAAYAKYKYRNEITKVAIFDFDLHHGNGTEEIVQMLNGKIFEKKFSYDKLCELKTRNFKQINWVDEDDAKNVLYISTHIYKEENEKENNNVYPFSGGIESNTDKKCAIYPGGIYNIPLVINKDKKSFIREEYRNIIRTKVLPRLYEFKPDLIFLSAGFDCHENEIINQKYINLNEFDFSFVTQQMQFVANKFCKGRLISVLEGGYNINAGVISPFTQSVFTHARFLNLSLNMFQISDIKLTGIKRQPQAIDENENKLENNNNVIKNEDNKNENKEIKEIKENEENKIKKENPYNSNMEIEKEKENNEKENVIEKNDNI